MKNRSEQSLLAVLALLALPVAGFSQTTTSSIQGNVVDEDGTPITGAEVVIEHVATRTTSTTRTNSSGIFAVRGLRVGGPYVATLSRSEEFGEEQFEDIHILLSEPYVLNFVTRTTRIEEVTVYASQQDVFLRIGAASNFDSENIAGQANVNRDFKNVIQQDPRVMIDYANGNNPVSIAGMNNRMNSLTVDGVRQNDDFGLNQSGFPTQRAPVPIDAIEQMSVQIAPFDVTFGGFTGGTINAVTKSGTNDWNGSFTLMHSDDSLVGDKSEADDIDIGDFDEDTLAATLSGPIVRDRLWFFANYEQWTASDVTALAYGPAGSGRVIEIDGVTQADIDEVSRISRDTYGFEPGALPETGQDVKSETFLLKLDWAINDDHMLSVTYQDVIGNDIRVQGSSASRNSLGLPSHWYDRSEDFQSLSGQLFSTWTDAFSTEIKIASQERTTGQNSLHGSETADMEIGTAGGGSIQLGSDLFRHSNGLQNDQLQWKIKGDYLWNNHTITAGIERDNLDVANRFNPSSNGVYAFDCINTLATDPVNGCANSYEGRVAARLFVYSNAFTNVKSDADAAYEYQVNSIYLQDVWDVSDRLTLQYGVRYDWYTSDDTPTLNPGFEARNGFDNTATLDGRDVFMPRFGFIYDFDGGTTLRGGVGLFSGGSPGVWIGTTFLSDGITIVSPDNAGAIEPTCAGVTGSVAALTDIDAFNVAQEVQDCMFAGAGNVEATDPSFDVLSTWRYNLAVDHEFDLGFLGDAWFFTAEAVISEHANAAEWQELTRTQIGQAPDGRPIYDTPPTYDVVITNTSQGFAHTFSLSVAKAWDTRAGLFDMALHYTYMDAEDVNPAQTTGFNFNYGVPPTFDRNGRILSDSSFLVKNRINGTLDWSKDLFGDNLTRVSMFFEFRSGSPFSYTMREGTGDTSVWGGHRAFAQWDSQLMFVPTIGDPNVIFSNTPDSLVNDPALEANFNNFVAAAGLEGYRGRILPRNHDTTSSYSRVNIRFQQEIGLFDIPAMGRSRLNLYLDIENFGNLLNDDWGRVERIGGLGGFTAVDSVSLNANGQYVYGSFDDFQDGINPETLINLASVYKIQVGFKFEF